MFIHIDDKIYKGCKFCVHICPHHVFKIKNKVNDEGFVVPEVDNENERTKCKLCKLICPDLAIYIVK